MQKIEGTLTYDDPADAQGAQTKLVEWYVRNDAIVGGGSHIEGDVVKFSYRLHEDLPKKTATQVADAFRDKLNATTSDVTVKPVEVDADGQNIVVETVYSDEELAEFEKQRVRNEAQVADGLSLDFGD